MEAGYEVSIQGDIVTLVEKIIHKEVSFTDWMKTIKSMDQKSTSPILPAECRLWHQHGKKEVFVFEQKPQVRNTRWASVVRRERPTYREEFQTYQAAVAAYQEAANEWRKRRDDAIRRGERFTERFTSPVPMEPQRIEEVRENVVRKLAFPFTIFIVQFQGGAFEKMWLFYSNEPLRDIKSPLYRPVIANVYRRSETDVNDCIVCIGDLRVSGTTVPEKARSMVDGFWSAGFNQDLIETFWTQHAVNPVFKAAEVDWKKGIEDWEKASAENPLFILESKWNKSEFTLETLLGV